MLTLEPHNVTQLAQANSTNDEAFKILNHSTEMLVWTTNQTQGRGSRGRPWLSPKGVGLAITLALRCEPWPHPAGFCYPLFAAVWLHKSLTQLLPHVSLHLKWPNDVLLDGRKLAGILCESRLVAQQATVALGLGLNLRDDPSLHSLEKPYATLAELPFPLEPQTLINTLSQNCGPLISSCLNGNLHKEWLNRCGIRLGQHLSIRQQGKTLDGSFDGLSADGGLCLRLKNGTVHVLSQTVDDAIIVPMNP